MGFRPFNKCLIIRRDAPIEMRNGIVVPDKFKRMRNCGEVVAKASDCEIGVTLGDRVHFRVDVAIIVHREDGLYICIHETAVLYAETNEKIFGGEKDPVEKPVNTKVPEIVRN